MPHRLKNHENKDFLPKRFFNPKLKWKKCSFAPAGCLAPSKETYNDPFFWF